MGVLDSVLRRASFAVVVHSADLEIREWNLGAEKLFGFTAAEAVGKKVPALLGAKSTATRKDGTSIGCLWEEEALDDGGTLAIVTDVSEARMRSRLLDVLMDNLKLVVWQVDPKGIFNFHDGRKGLEGTGLAPGAVLGLDAFQAFPARENEAESVLGAAMKGTATSEVSEAMGRNWLSFTLPLYDDDQKLDGAAGITLDVTEATVREKELQAKLDLIQHQQQTIRSLAIPLIETWEGVLTVPMVGTVDTERASEVMERLLTEITRRKARFAIVDLTGVEQVDMDVAAHIVNLARSIRLLGSEGIITGIRPSMSQAMVQLGVDLSGIRTLATLRQALGYCLDRLRKGV